MNTEQERAELLPCPFCGCAMSLSAVARDWWRITGGHDEDCILYDQRHDAPQTDYQKKALIDDWNRRAALQSQKPKGNDIMLSGVIRMPFEMAMADPISRMQFYQRAQQALNELEALQSQDREEIMEMALCESRRLVLRIGQAYRFVPMEGCKTCEEMKAEHDQAYSIDHARRIEGEGE